MTLSVDSETQRLIEQWLKSGKYTSAEAVVRAAMHALDQQGSAADFDPGELDRLLETGERSIQREGTVPVERVRKHFQDRAKSR